MNHWNWHIGFVKFLRRHHHSNLSNLAEIMPEIKIKKTEKRHFHRKWWMKRGKKLSHCCFLDSFPMLLSNYILISTINLLNNYVHTIRRLFSLNSSVNISNSNAFYFQHCTLSSVVDWIWKIWILFCSIIITKGLLKKLFHFFSCRLST